MSGVRNYKQCNNWLDRIAGGDGDHEPSLGWNLAGSPRLSKDAKSSLKNSMEGFHARPSNAPGGADFPYQHLEDTKEEEEHFKQQVREFVVPVLKKVASEGKSPVLVNTRIRQSLIEKLASEMNGLMQKATWMKPEMRNKAFEVVGDFLKIACNVKMETTRTKGMFIRIKTRLVNARQSDEKCADAKGSDYVQEALKDLTALNTTLVESKAANHLLAFIAEIANKCRRLTMECDDQRSRKFWQAMTGVFIVALFGIGAASVIFTAGMSVPLIIGVTSVSVLLAGTGVAAVGRCGVKAVDAGKTSNGFDAMRAGMQAIQGDLEEVMNKCAEFSLTGTQEEKCDAALRHIDLTIKALDDSEKHARIQAYLNIVEAAEKGRETWDATSCDLINLAANTATYQCIRMPSVRAVRAEARLVCCRRRCDAATIYQNEGRVAISYISDIINPHDMIDM
eukprot:CAMPEP_0167819428 /NCGR_PEP_ID=MMETSP0112_2-20121227/5390_1 /TAXON_ID=91324 /ORGANISM="Lotharella globosa, Strain CCCM811" /LENGTH=450 /DNA_ID=CAMNT_0007719593 /DNA_START=134 /DNA_END=1484 /DNA_ORIENTATION=-